MLIEEVSAHVLLYLYCATIVCGELNPVKTLHIFILLFCWEFIFIFEKNGYAIYDEESNQCNEISDGNEQDSGNTEDWEKTSGNENKSDDDDDEISLKVPTTRMSTKTMKIKVRSTITIKVRSLNLYGLLFH